MKFYSMRGSRFAARCRIQILAKGLDIPVVTVPYPVPGSYLQINPLGKVPALDTGTRLLPESEVICEYLEDLGTGVPLRPDDIEERATMRLIVRVVDLYVAPPLEPLYGLIFRRESPVDSIDARIAAGFPHLAPFLEAKKYAVGSRLTLADCALMPILLHIRVVSELLGAADPVRQQPFATYYRETLKDPSVAAVLSDVEQHLRATLTGH